jgi:predicted phosphate transport protein (TIGR00153 family)
MARFHLLPPDERFIERLSSAAQNVVTGTEALFDLMSNYVDVERAVRRIEDLEHVGDRLTHEIVEAANRAFVTPFDREDITALAGTLDDVLDGAEEAARRLLTYHIERPEKLGLSLARVLLEQSKQIEQALKRLEDRKQTELLRTHLVELHRLENDADGLLNEALGALYRDVRAIPALILAIQWGDIYSILERATDAAERVAVVLETIIVKRA